MASVAALPPEIAVPLKKARRNALLRRLILAALTASTAALLAAGAAPLFTQGQPGEAAALAGLLALAGGTAIAVVSRPSLVQLARRADETFGLGERISTTISLAPKASGLSAAINDALRADAADRARLILPQRLEPLFGRTLLPALVALLLAAGVAFLAPVYLTSRSAAVPPAAESVAVDPDARTANLEAIAEAIAADAEKRDSTYLRAVAEAVAELAHKTGPDTSQAAISQALDALLDHARLGYGTSLPAWLRRPSDDDADRQTRDRNFAQLAAQAKASTPVALPHGGSGEELVPELLSERDPQRNAQAVPMRPGQLRVADDKAELRLAGSDIERPGENANTPADFKDSAVGGGSPTLGGQNSDEPVDLEGAAAKLAGGAAQSEAGASRLAGGGTQALADPSRKASAPLETGEQMLLPSDKYRPGKRIRLQVTPPAAATGEAGAVASEGADLTHAEDAIAIARDAPSLYDQATFSRFFRPQEAQGAR